MTTADSLDPAASGPETLQTIDLVPLAAREFANDTGIDPAGPDLIRVARLALYWLANPKDTPEGSLPASPYADELRRRIGKVVNGELNG